MSGNPTHLQDFFSNLSSLLFVVALRLNTRLDWKRVRWLPAACVAPCDTTLKNEAKNSLDRSSSWFCHSCPPMSFIRGFVGVFRRGLLGYGHFHGRTNAAETATPPALLKGHQSGIIIMGPLADALCVAQVAWLLIFLQETGWDEAISSQLCRAKHSKFMSSWSWDQVEQDGHIGTSARTSFDKLSQLGSFRMVGILTFLT